MTEIIERGLTPEETAEREAYDAPEAVYEREYKDVQRQRQQAYRDEADPLFFKSERGKASRKEWEAKIAEIDARFPYPDPPKVKK